MFSTTECGRFQGNEKTPDRYVHTGGTVSGLDNNRMLLGGSPAFVSILKTIEAVAARQCSMIIFGETGVGKEMVAREIHANSSRSERVFVPVDCTTLTGQLFESQLFGHTKGAFTGAVADTLGFFRAADGGTIFLDEISEIPLDLQAKLLRVLQENTVTPIGSVKPCRIDVRILCATNCDLQKHVDEGKFRSDLYYRLNVITLEVPPLRKRREDILPLAEHFLAQQSEFYNEPAKTLNAETRKLLENYSWPGNIRHLANVMERAYVLTASDEITPASLPTEVIIAPSCNGDELRLPTLNEANRKLIIQALETTKGRKMAASRLLGLERRTLNRLIDKLKITSPPKAD